MITPSGPDEGQKFIVHPCWSTFTPSEKDSAPSNEIPAQESRTFSLLSLYNIATVSPMLIISPGQQSQTKASGLLKRLASTSGENVYPKSFERVTTHLASP